ncbi:MAG TPA: 50S ribosomal protein L33 [Patescibacteria group bacterium]|nr:50S ribosomal protein L33 [Patescibacteria group bacterium]
MAKKSKTIKIQLMCTECKERNYTLKKNIQEHKEKFEFQKHCPRCRKHTLHKEVRIPNPKK